MKNPCPSLLKRTVLAALTLPLFTGGTRAATINTQWDFNDSGNASTSVSSVGGYNGNFVNGVTRSADGGGFTGLAGDYSLSFPGTGAGAMMDATTTEFMDALNALAGTQAMSISFWQNVNALSDWTVHLCWPRPECAHPLE